ncbi:MAG: nucleotidyltransferase domain-containing protein [Acidimicrobiales bacterium]
MVALDRASAAGRLIYLLGGLRTGVLFELGLLARALDPAPCSVVVFGSFARGEAGPGSDVDLLAVRPSQVDEERWAEGLAEFSRQVGVLTGNHPQVIDLQLEDLRRRARSGRAKIGGAFWSSEMHDAITVAGSDLGTLVGKE